MLQTTPVDLISGDLDHNYRELLMWALVIAADAIDDEELAEEEEELLRHITSFTIVSTEYGEETFAVEKGKFRTAAVLLYLATIHGSDSFHPGASDLQFIREYFPASVVADVLDNPSTTTHLALRALLSKGYVQVKITHTPIHHH